MDLKNDPVKGLCLIIITDVTVLKEKQKFGSFIKISMNLQGTLRTKPGFVNRETTKHLLECPQSSPGEVNL